MRFFRKILPIKKEKAIRVYVVEITYDDATSDTVAVTSMYLEIPDDSNGLSHLVEIGDGASEVHATRGVPENRENSSAIINSLYRQYNAGMSLYLKAEDIRAVKIIAVVDYNFGRELWQE